MRQAIDSKDGEGVLRLLVGWKSLEKESKF